MDLGDCMYLYHSPPGLERASFTVAGDSTQALRSAELPARSIDGRTQSTDHS